MTSLYRRFVHVLEKETTRSGKAIIKRVDSISVDIQIAGSPTLVRNVNVEGEIKSLKSGQVVTIIWVNNRPIVVSTKST